MADYLYGVAIGDVVLYKCNSVHVFTNVQIPLDRPYQTLSETRVSDKVCAGPTSNADNSSRANDSNNNSITP